MADSKLTTMSYTAESLVFLDESVPENDVCIIPKGLWSMWIQTQTDEILLVKITAEGKEYTLHIHSYHDNDPDTIYIPSWCFGNTPLEVEMARVPSPPIATKLILQPLDSELYHCDIAAAVSEHLSKWQVLSEGTTLTVPCPELGGFLVDIFVQKTEPGPTVLLRGEVPMELAEPLETVVEWQPPPKKEPEPQPPQQEQPPEAPEDFDEILPIKKSAAFVPFSGKGYTLR